MKSKVKLQPARRAALTIAGRSATWPALRDKWRAHLDREQSEATRVAYMNAVDRFAKWLADRRQAGSVAPPAPASLADVKPADVAAWRDALRRRYSLATVSLYLAGVRAFYAWAIQKGAPISNPATGVRGKGRKGLGAHKRDTFTDDEVRSILASCKPRRPEGARDLALLSLMAYTGIRTIEAQRVEMGDLESKGGRVILWVWGKGHGGPDDFVVLPAPAEAALRSWMAMHPKASGPIYCSISPRSAGRRLTLRHLRRIILEHIRSAGIRSPRKTAHSFRHTAITNAIRHGASPIQAQRMARHLDIKTTLAYYHEADRLDDPAEDRIDYEESGDGEK